MVNELLATKRSTYEKLLNPNIKGKEKLEKVYRAQKAELQKELRRLKDTGWSNLSEEIQASYERKYIKNVYGVLRQAVGPQSSTYVPLKSKDGNEVIKDPPGIMSRWREHFVELFHNPSLVNMDVINNIPQRVIMQHMDDAPSIEEVKLSIRKLRSNKAPGLDGIPAEILKASRDHISSEIHSLLCQV
uniref:Reverse transcriptase domain-containing protein n=1 Tax=Octopus bimaculoides TaxID=37653 RepID=A0A0L8G3A6_OCTBM